MGISQYDTGAAVRPAWNVGKHVGAKRALKIKQIWSIRFVDGQQKAPLAKRPIRLKATLLVLPNKIQLAVFQMTTTGWFVDSLLLGQPVKEQTFGDRPMGPEATPGGPVER